MFFSYLRKELAKRLKQTVLIASGLGVAIGLVVVVSSVSAGIQSAQTQALSGLYGIGTDVTVTKAGTPGQGFKDHFNIGGSQGSTSGQTRTFNASQLRLAGFSGTFKATELAKAKAVAGVKSAVATLKLESTTFSGKLPTFTQQSPSSGTSSNSSNSFGNPSQRTVSSGAGNSGAPSFGPSGGFDGNGGSAFGINRFTVEGIGTATTTTIGPLAGTKIKSGRSLGAADATKYVAVVDAAYSTSNKLKVGGTIKMASTKFAIVGILESTSSSATTPSNVYIPLGVAQKLSNEAGKVSNFYIAAKSATDIAGVKAELKKLLPSATVSSSSDLASTVSGSLSDAANLVGSMGTWLSLAVLLAAFASAILFTTSGVNRRTREFGTLKAIGWRSRRIVGQVLGESIVTSLIGGALGLLIGLAGIEAINAWGPTLSASAARVFPGGFGSGGGFGGFGGGSNSGGGFPSGGFPGGPGGADHTGTTVSTVLSASIDPTVIFVAIGIAVLGGVLAGVFGGLRASKLSPAEALRSVN